jgi:hypothetical protein
MPDPAGPLSATARALCGRWLGATGRTAEAALVEMESLLPPADYMAALQALAEARPEARDPLMARRAAERLAGQTLQPFRLAEQGAAHSHYAAPGASQGRTLVTLLTGAASRPGTWTPVFLQALDARRVEVLMLRDRTGRHFRTGCSGLAGTLPGLVAAVDRRFWAGGYARHVVMGVSRGGHAALGFGQLVRAERAIAFGATPRSDPLRLLAGQAMPPAFDPLCACLTSPVPIIAIHGEGNAEDAAHARMVTALYGGTRLVVRGLADHGIVHHVSAIGQLPELLRMALDMPTDRPEAAFPPDPAPARPPLWKRLLGAEA